MGRPDTPLNGSETVRLSPSEHVERVDLSSSVVAWEEVATETLARILEDQRNYTEAAQVYRALAAKRPAEARGFDDRADELLDKARGRSRRSAR